MIWTVPGEEEMLPVWKKEDSDFFNSVDSMYYYHREQIKDFLEAVQSGKKRWWTPQRADAQWSCSQPSASTKDNAIIKFRAEIRGQGKMFISYNEACAVTALHWAGPRAVKRQVRLYRDPP